MPGRCLVLKTQIFGSQQACEPLDALETGTETQANSPKVKNTQDNRYKRYKLVFLSWVPDISVEQQPDYKNEKLPFHGEKNGLWNNAVSVNLNVHFQH